MKSQNAKLSVESLEGRDMLSWTAVPGTFSWPSSVNVGFNSNGRTGTATISNNEVDMYNFVAPRTGTYTITAAKNGSRIDTVLGVFRMNGTRIAGNDDISPSNTNSQVRVDLTGGVKYAFGVTNYTGTPRGGYRWTVDGPPLSVSHSRYASGTNFYTSGDGSLVGNRLTLNVYGSNSSQLSYYDHKVEIYLLNGNNRRIYGPWSVTVPTAGFLIPGTPREDSHSYTFNVSGFDLRNVRGMEIVIY